LGWVWVRWFIPGLSFVYYASIIGGEMSVFDRFLTVFSLFFAIFSL